MSETKPRQLSEDEIVAIEESGALDDDDLAGLCRMAKAMAQAERYLGLMIRGLPKDERAPGAWHGWFINNVGGEHPDGATLCEAIESAEAIRKRMSRRARKRK